LQILAVDPRQQRTPPARETVSPGRPMSLLTPRAPTNALDVQAWADFEREKERI